MPIKNTTTDYGSVAKWLHWLTALLFLGSYVSVYYRQWFTEARAPENWTALQLHFSIGVTIAVVVALRLIWRACNQAPAPEPGSALAHRAARWGHIALYAVMIIMPVTGYLGTGADTEFFFLFDITNFRDSWLFSEWIGPRISYETFEKPFDLLHKQVFGELLLWLLILGHAGAALYHHFWRGDRTLRRMTLG